MLTITRTAQKGDYSRTDTLELSGPYAKSHAIDFLLHQCTSEELIHHAQALIEHAEGRLAAEEEWEDFADKVQDCADEAWERKQKGDMPEVE